MSRPCSRATAGNLRGRPDQDRNDDAGFRRFDAPRSDVSSQGWTTTVVAGGTSLARAISRSYLRAAAAFERADGRDRADLAVTWSESIDDLSATVRADPAEAPRHDAFACDSFRCCRKGVGPDCRSVSTPNSRATRCSRSLSSAESSPLAVSTCSISSNALLPRLGVRRKHRRNRRQRRFRVDQQHEELLAHQRLEVRQAACRRARARMRRTASKPRSSTAPARHPDIEQSADDGFAQAARRNARLEFGNPVLQQFAMQRALARPCAAGASLAGSMPTAACSAGEP